MIGAERPAIEVGERAVRPVQSHVRRHRPDVMRLVVSLRGAGMAGLGVALDRAIGGRCCC